MLSAIFFPAEEFISIYSVLLHKLCHSIIVLLFRGGFFCPHFCYSVILIGVNRMMCEIHSLCVCATWFLSYGILKFCALSSVTFSIFLNVLGFSDHYSVLSSCFGELCTIIHQPGTWTRSDFFFFFQYVWFLWSLQAVLNLVSRVAVYALEISFNTT